MPADRQPKSQSGVALIADEARGMYLSPKVYSDLDIPTIEALPPSAPHRPVDLLVVAADAEGGYARTHILMPSVVYGVATGPLVDAGVANPHTAMIPIFVRTALSRGSVGVMGKGISMWANVHVDDGTYRAPVALSASRSEAYYVR